MKTHPRDTRDKNTTERSLFFVLFFRARNPSKENGALSETGGCCTYIMSFTRVRARGQAPRRQEASKVEPVHRFAQF